MDGVVLSRLTEPGSKVVVISDNPGSARVLGLYDRETSASACGRPAGGCGKDQRRSGS